MARGKRKTLAKSSAVNSVSLSDDVQALLALSPGAIFRRADLHVHTPASPDIHDSWKESTPKDIVDNAVSNGMDIIAITDHNSTEWCDAVQAAAEGTRLAVFPGVEISTSEGHLLGIFNLGTPADSIRELLIACGIPGSKIGKPEALAKGQFDDVARRVEDAGGIVIAAHVDQAKGFWSVLDSSRTRRQQLYSSPSILALEVVSDAAITAFQTGDVGGARRLPCLQSSDCWPEKGDSHHVDAIGRRHSLIKLDEISVTALRQALLDPDLRVCLASNQPTEPHVAIEGIAVSGGFLDGQRLRFSDNISCLIGGTGAGKSLTIELMRFVLDQQTSKSVLPKIAEEVHRLLRFALGDSANVHLLVRKGDDRYVIERAWQGGEGSDPVVYRVRGEEVELVEGPFHLPSFFPIKAFSQSEVIEHSREPLARLSLIDDLIDIDAEHVAIKKLKSKLRESAKAIIETRQTVETVRLQIKELPGLKEQIKALGSFFEDKRVKGHAAWYKEQETFKTATDQVDLFLKSVDQDFPWPDTDWDIPDESPNKALMSAVRKVAFNLAKLSESQQSAYAKAAEVAKGEIQGLQNTWKPLFDEAEREYQRLLTELDTDRRGLASLNQKLNRLRKKESEIQKAQKQVDEKLQPQLEKSEATRDQFLSELQNMRRSIREKRKAKAKELSDRLENRVRITIKGDGDDRAFIEALTKIRVGSHIQENDIRVIAESLHPVPLVKSLLSTDFDAPSKESGLAAAIFERLHVAVVERKRLEDLYELQLVDLEDVVRIQFAVEKQEYRELESLAHGQKCTVVLMIALAEGDAPLIVDQPEDALHAPWIEDYIVARLRGDRGKRQSIFATRNGNVLVSADAEQILAMEADAHSGKVMMTGALDRFETRELVLYHVEGGREAFERRKQKYGF